MKTEEVKMFEIWCQWNDGKINATTAMIKIDNVYWNCGLQKHWMEYCDR